MTGRAIAIALAVAVLSLAGGCRKEGKEGRARVAVPPDEAAELLIDRNWLDVWPKDDRDRLHVYRFVPSMGGGVFQDRTLFAGTFELFRFQIDGEHLTIEWPHSKEEDRMVFRVSRVDGPPPFDLRLELSGTSRGPRTYYGRSSEAHGHRPARGPDQQSSPLDLVPGSGGDRSGGEASADFGLSFLSR